MAVQTQIQMRRDTAANWTSTNPTLAAGEWGFETDTGLTKIGNGSTAWTSLAYQSNNNSILDIIFGNIPDRYVIKYGPTGALSTNNGQLKGFVIPIFTTIALEQLSLNEVNSIPGSTGSVVRMGIYSCNSLGVPTTLVSDVGTVSTTTTGRKTISGLNITLTPGLYGFVAVPQGAPATNPTIRYVTPNVLVQVTEASSFGSVGSASFNSWGVSGITGALPSTLTPSPDQQPHGLSWKWKA